MKDAKRDTAHVSDEHADAWVREGLRALRESLPPPESKRATLAQLGVESVPLRVERGRAPAPSPPTAGWREGARWLAWGLLLGSVAVVLRRLFE